MKAYVPGWVTSKVGWSEATAAKWLSLVVRPSLACQFRYNFRNKLLPKEPLHFFRLLDTSTVIWSPYLFYQIERSIIYFVSATMLLSLEPITNIRSRLDSSQSLFFPGKSILLLLATLHILLNKPNTNKQYVSFFECDPLSACTSF